MVLRCPSSSAWGGDPELVRDSTFPRGRRPTQYDFQGAPNLANDVQLECGNGHTSYELPSTPRLVTKPLTRGVALMPQLATKYCRGIASSAATLYRAYLMPSRVADTATLRIRT